MGVVSTNEDFAKGFAMETDIPAPAIEPAEAKPEGEVKPQPEVKEEKPLIKDEQKVEIAAEVKPEDFEQKWKSVQGIVKHKDSRIAELEQELERAKTANPAEPAREEKPATEPELRGEERKYAAAISKVSLRAIELDEDDPESKKAYEDALEAALEIRDRIDNKKREIYLAEAEEKVSGRISSTLAAKDDELAVADVVASAIKEFPFLNVEDEKNANPYAIKLTRIIASEYVAQGISRAEAVTKAAAEVGPMFKTMPAGTMPSLPKKESKINEAELKSMAAVKTNSAPIKPSQKAAGGGSFADGWSKPI